MILVYSRSEEEHKDHLCLGFQKLRDHRLYAKLSKCEFWLKQVAFLGHIISKGGIYVDPNKIQDVLGLNAPTNSSDIRSFLDWLAIIRGLTKGSQRQLSLWLN
jgi:hypothetical protein